MALLLRYINGSASSLSPSMSPPGSSPKISPPVHQIIRKTPIPDAAGSAKTNAQKMATPRRSCKDAASMLEISNKLSELRIRRYYRNSPSRTRKANVTDLPRSPVYRRRADFEKKHTGHPEESSDSTLFCDVDDGLGRVRRKMNLKVCRRLLDKDAPRRERSTAGSFRIRIQRQSPPAGWCHNVNDEQEHSDVLVHDGDGHQVESTGESVCDQQDGDIHFDDIGVMVDERDGKFRETSFCETFMKAQPSSSTPRRQSHSTLRHMPYRVSFSEEMSFESDDFQEEDEDDGCSTVVARSPGDDTMKPTVRFPCVRSHRRGAIVNIQIPKHLLTS